MKNADKKGPFCHDCVAEFPATSHCENCVLNLCKKCTEYHQGCVRFVGHKIIDIQDVTKKSTSPKRYCPKHNELLKYFCEQCKEVVCNDCMVSIQHKQHSFSLVSETTAKAKEELKEKLQKMKEKKGKMDYFLLEAKAFYKEVIDEDKASVELIKKAFDEVRKALTAREEELIAQVAIQSKTKGEQKLLFDNFSKAVNKVTQSVNYVESVVNENCDDLEMISDMSKQMDKVSKEYNLDVPLLCSRLPVAYNGYVNPDQTLFLRVPDVTRFAVKHSLPRMMRKKYAPRHKEVDWYNQTSLGFHMDLHKRYLHPQHLEIITQQLKAFSM